MSLLHKYIATSCENSLASATITKTKPEQKSSWSRQIETIYNQKVNFLAKLTTTTLGQTIIQSFCLI